MNGAITSPVADFTDRVGSYLVDLPPGAGIEVDGAAVADVAAASRIISASPRASGIRSRSSFPPRSRLRTSVTGGNRPLATSARFAPQTDPAMVSDATKAWHVFGWKPRQDLSRDRECHGRISFTRERNA